MSHTTSQYTHKHFFRGVELVEDVKQHVGVFGMVLEFDIDVLVVFGKCRQALSYVIIRQHSASLAGRDPLYPYQQQPPHE